MLNVFSFLLGVKLKAPITTNKNLCIAASEGASNGYRFGISVDKDDYITLITSEQGSRMKIFQIVPATSQKPNCYQIESPTFPGKFITYAGPEATNKLVLTDGKDHVSGDYEFEFIPASGINNYRIKNVTTQQFIEGGDSEESLPLHLVSSQDDTKSIFYLQYS